MGAGGLQGRKEGCRVELTLTVTDVDGRAVVATEGAIDLYTAGILRDELARLHGAGSHRVVVDLTDLDFLDSTGLGVLIGGRKAVAAHGGDLKLVCPQERFHKLFRITGLDQVFPIFGSLPEALDD